MDYGIVTLAIGKKYIEEAVNLACSLIYNSPDVPRTLICDAGEHEREQLKSYFTTILSVKKEFGNPFRQKLSMEQYSPYQKTIFLDADCLCIKDISPLFDHFQDRDFSYVGFWETHGEWYRFLIEDVIKRFDIPHLAKFNGGMFYFENTATGHRVLSEARNYYDHLEDYGVQNYRGTYPPDEPALSFALSNLKISPASNSYETMVSSGGREGRLKVNILKSVCVFNKQERIASPRVLHCARKADTLYYQRESFKIYWKVRTGAPAFLLQTITFLWVAPWQKIIHTLKKVTARLKKE